MKAIILLLTILMFASCKKESAQPVVVLSEKTMLNVAYGNDPAQIMDVYLPEGRSPDTTKLLVLIHGGSWSGGDKSEFTDKIPALRQKVKHYAIANINYRLATPNSNAFPAQENDLKAAIRFLQQNAGSYNISSTVVLLGTSAGAHLAQLQAYKNASSKISAVVSFSGPSDLAALYHQTTNAAHIHGLQLLLGGNPETNPAMYQSSSPIHFISPQAPPTIIIHGGADDLVPVSQSIALKNKLQLAGVPYELHIYQNTGHDIGSLQLLMDAYTRVEAFLAKHVR